MHSYEVEIKIITKGRPNVTTGYAEALSFMCRLFRSGEWPTAAPYLFLDRC